MAPRTLFSKQRHRVALSATEHQQLAAFAHSQHPGDGAHAEQRLLASVARQPLAFRSLERSLHSLCEEQSISHLLIQNLLIDAHLPPSPANGVRPPGKSWESESALLQIANAAKVWPLGYVEENNCLIHQIAPAAGHDREVSSAGVAALRFHSDLAILRAPYRPQFLFLTGLRNEDATPTLLAELDDVLAALQQREPSLVEALREPRFRLGSPDSLQLFGGKRLCSEPRPLIAPGVLGRDTIAANLNSVTATDPRAEQALLALQEVLPEVTRSIVIGPGEALVFNNETCLHGRRAIPSGQRWLQRLYCRRSLKQLRQATGSGSEKVIFPISRLILE